jgi:hypothetical protein
MSRAKRITVVMLCQWVEADGTPVNQHGVAYGRGWQKCVSLEKVRTSENKFCPKDLAKGHRQVLYEHREAIKCRCHKKLRLTRRAAASDKEK